MTRWRFGDFVLDLDARELLRAGRAVTLSPKGFQLLGALVEGHGRALSKAELQERLWPDTFVVEKNLTNLIGEVREALGDDAGRPRFIRTVHRFGYAFSEPPSLDGGDTDSGRQPARRHNLPAQLTGFIGRDREIAELLPLVTSARLLTLTGAGGCGKTRLALEVAAKVLDHFADGAWVVDLAALSNPGLVPQSVAAALGIRDGPVKAIHDTLANYVRARQLLIVLDNCEHLIAACAPLVEALLHSGARLRVLATSREGLGLTGETIWRVPSLSLPDPAQSLSEASLVRCDAPRLLIERGAAVNASFAVTADNASAIASVCQRLDGIPLAIELAAARLNVLSIEQVNSRLHDRFRLLTGGSRTAVARQRTLEATVDWSHALLSDTERQVLRRLSVFAGGWTIEAAEEVVADDGAARADVLDLLSRLVDKSLVNVEADTGATPRYCFLETVRQYARDRLLQSGEAEPVRNRHLAFFHDLVRRAEPELSRASQVSWLNRLEREHDNLRSALEWCLADPARADQGLEFAAVLWWFWIKCGYLREGQEWMERALGGAAGAGTALGAKGRRGLGALRFFQGDFPGARVALRESEVLSREAGDQAGAGFSLGLTALASLEAGDAAECLRSAHDALDMLQGSPEPWWQGPALSCLAYLAMLDGDFDRAGRMHEQNLALGRQQGDTWGIGVVLYDLAMLRSVQGRHAEARALCAEGIALSEAAADQRGIAWCLGILSAADAAEGHLVRAARLRGAMEGLLDNVGALVQESYHHWLGDRSLEAMRNGLGTRALEDALDEGRRMPLSEAIQFGLTATR